MKTLAERLKFRREQFGKAGIKLSQADVAKAVAALRKKTFSQQNYQALESGASKSSVELPAIAEVLQCNLKWLRDNIGDPPPPPVKSMDVGGGNVSSTAGLIDRILRMPEKKQFKIARFMDIIDDD